MTTETVAEFFDEKADAYTRHRRTDPTFAQIRQIVKSVVPSTPSHILDLGCGCGTVAEDLITQGHRVVGVDISKRMIEAAERSRAQLPAPLAERLEYRCGTADDFDLQFEAVVCLGVLEYVDDAGKFLKNLTERVQPGGRIVVQVPNAQAWGEKFMRLAFWLNRLVGRATTLPVQRKPLSANQIKNQLGTLGWSETQTTYALYYIYPFNRIFPVSSEKFHQWCQQGRPPWLARYLAHTLVITARR